MLAVTRRRPGFHQFAQLPMSGACLLRIGWLNRIRLEDTQQHCRCVGQVRFRQYLEQFTLCNVIHNHTLLLHLSQDQ